MEGWSGALDVVKGYLEAELTGKLDELRTRLGTDGPLSLKELPDPQLFTTEERAQLPFQDYPAVLVTARDVTRTREAERSHRGRVYLRAYRVRVWFWVRLNGYARVTRLRNRYSLALTELILGRLSLGTPNAGVDPATLREVPSEGVSDKAGRSIAASYLEFEVTIEETVEIAPRGDVTAQTVTTSPLD